MYNPFKINDEVTFVRTGEIGRINYSEIGKDIIENNIYNVGEIIEENVFLRLCVEEMRRGIPITGLHFSRFNIFSPADNRDKP